MEFNTMDLVPLTDYLTNISSRGRTMLLPALHGAQEMYGWLPREVQVEIARVLRIPLADIHGVIEFYTMFYNEPTARQVIRVCEDLACHLAGGDEVIHGIEKSLGLSHGETSSDGKVTLEHVPCLGMCEHAPAALNGVRPAGNLHLETISSFLKNETDEPHGRIFGQPRWLSRRLGLVDPGSLESYEALGGYKGLRTAIELTPEAVIERIERSGILGRGGAMFPLGQKLKFTRGAPESADEKHIVVNADESEPGTFKDRPFLEGDPFAIIEAATLAAYAVGAENGWIFIRGEYPRGFARLSTAVEAAQSAGYLGKNILGVRGFNFNIEVRLGAGAYICGEETALFEAIEGRRGFPRIKPPFPTTHGLFGQPTAINNIETLIAALIVFENGLEAWRSVGTADSPGTKLFCLSGHVRQPGLYEVPFGFSVRQLIEMAGGGS
jgi:NADH-quinone oxidoreductase subunit F